MRRHKKLYTSLFRKTHRRRPNGRLQYLRERRKTRAKKVKRALDKASLRSSQEGSSDLRQKKRARGGGD